MTKINDMGRHTIETPHFASGYKPAGAFVRSPSAACFSTFAMPDLTPTKTAKSPPMDQAQAVKNRILDCPAAVALEFFADVQDLAGATITPIRL